MRTILMTMLLASAAAAPAFAEERDNEPSPVWSERQERSQAREQRQQVRQERFNSRSIERTEPILQQQEVEVQRPAQRAEGVSRWTRDSIQQAGETSRWTRDPDQQAGETARWTRDRTGGWSPAGGDLRQSNRPVPNVMRTPSPLVVSGTPREGTQPPLREESRRRAIQWSTNWRHNDRYDWRSWRNRHRSWFHFGLYYDPFGWSYRPYEIGWRLWPSYYSRSYWINDPWRYRLPYAPAGYVWVRYWNDALLVDRWSGEVVDVVRNFFW